VSKKLKPKDEEGIQNPNEKARQNYRDSSQNLEYSLKNLIQDLLGIIWIPLQIIWEFIQRNIDLIQNDKDLKIHVYSRNTRARSTSTLCPLFITGTPPRSRRFLIPRSRRFLISRNRTSKQTRVLIHQTCRKKWGHGVVIQRLRWARMKIFQNYSESLTFSERLSILGLSILIAIHWRQVNFERGVSPISLVTIIP